MAEIRVTDKRMFTPDGKPREESVPSSSAREPELEVASPGSVSATPQEHPAPAEKSEQRPDGPSRIELPGAAQRPQTPTSPSFYDLLGVLAEPISLYLGDLGDEITLPNGESAENLELARLHIDLLELLRQRTAGNLRPEEQSVLDDLLYRVRLRYVEKCG